jgi:hypothetical protein
VFQSSSGLNLITILAVTKHCDVLWRTSLTLTLIMQNLFWLAVTVRRPVTIRLIKLAMKPYRESSGKARVHSDISEYVRQAGVFDRAKRDTVLDKIVELIDQNRIESAEMHALNGRITEIDSSGGDEPWDVEE